MRPILRAVLALLLFVGVAPFASAQAPVSYRLSLPAPEHRWMQVEVTFSDLPAEPLDVRMSRSSPGRYALHEFAKNVFGMAATDGAGRPLPTEVRDVNAWTVAGHDGTVRLSYRVFGDRVDGTYLGVDSTHAHVNMPAALVWARGLEAREATVEFVPPDGASWRVATQLLPGPSPLTFSAPNLAYLMDSPSEFSDMALRTFAVSDTPGAPTFRLAVHHLGSEADMDALVADARRVVVETGGIFGEFPRFEGNTYTFIADYLPWASGDGMEHRNSTILTSASAIRSNRGALVDTIAHEFVHAWNVERIRPRSLEPFDLERANVSGELWLAEGFTSYYGPLVQHRAGLTSLRELLDELAGTINAVVGAPGRQVRSAVEMSQFAAFTDAATWLDRTVFGNAFLSYYTWGEAIALGLDLDLRGRSDGSTTLDHFMQALWREFGAPGGSRPGTVDRPYTLDDVERTLAEVAGDATFARDFFARYVRGRDVVDYAALLARAGIVARPVAPGQATAGALVVQNAGGQVRVAASVPFGSPAYDAGLERDDLILEFGPGTVSTGGDVDRAIRNARPGDELAVVFERRGERRRAVVRLVEDTRIELVPAENAGQSLTDAQRAFRQAWLGSTVTGR
ncbi:MAG: M61 family metallopeptidase [Vicinamibacterales bacterium]